MYLIVLFCLVGAVFTMMLICSNGMSSCPHVIDMCRMLCSTAFVTVAISMLFFYLSSILMSYNHVHIVVACQCMLSFWIMYLHASFECMILSWLPLLVVYDNADALSAPALLRGIILCHIDYGALFMGIVLCHIGVLIHKAFAPALFKGVVSFPFSVPVLSHWMGDILCYISILIMVYYNFGFPALCHWMSIAILYHSFVLVLTAVPCELFSCPLETSFYGKAYVHKVNNALDIVGGHRTRIIKYV